VAGRGLLKAAQEASLATQMVIGSSTTFTAVKLHEKSDQKPSALFKYGYI
jgi:hypothetical protein